MKRHCIHITRERLLKRAYPNARKLGQVLASLSFRVMQVEGWVSAMVPKGKRHERVAFVRNDHPWAELIRRVAEGHYWLPVQLIDEKICASWCSREGLGRVAHMGLAVVDFGDNEVKVRPADPRKARCVNLARLGVSRRGFKAQRLVEAFLACEKPKGRDCRLTAGRRSQLHDILRDEWEIVADDLLDQNRTSIHLVSNWTVADVVGLAVVGM